VIVELGDRHLDDLLSIADPLMVSDLPTCCGHPTVIPSRRGAAATRQSTLLDSVDDPSGARRSTAHNPVRPALRRRPRLAALHPWRERIAATFDPPKLRAQLGRSRRSPSAITLLDGRGMLLIGWLGSRLDGD